MPIGWGGADPVQSGDADDYELGTEQRANVDITLTKVRVWSDGSEDGYTGRVGKIWSTAGVLLAEATMPDSLPSGWSSYDLDTPVTRTVGQRYVVSYPSGGRWGVLSGALTNDVTAASGAVTSLASGSATNGNGIFNTTPDTFPTTAFSASFYGIDTEYNIGITGAAPVISGVTLQVDELDVVATIAATDAEGLSGASYEVDWGDGNTSSGSGASFSHTYTTAGLKAILASVEDSTGLSGHFATAVNLVSESDFDPKAIIDAVASHAAESGHFDAINKHEPKNAPGHGVTGHVWMQHLGPVRSSGLRSTSALLILNLRVQTNMLQEPQDDIDPLILDAVNALMLAYSRNFTLGGLIRNVDLLGQNGTSLRADAGYLQIGGPNGGMYRVMVVTIPMVINDVWEQIP